ncbi:MAG: hypothetical protein A3I77_04580 [Gammaproteobacteria bacterium RIFCSPLOWO2_02_FULL_42_14]|nr:MAG: hypothetical protein A3B71_05880 [Gammaproteobacteria bacterium RIFCSPHIGHO2_02_FULL_42_43]OGT51518.1 MAG: hypothetical protein A3E54_05645 [Gammaproteobacteria bacterium RIFCSPHIGHO2_12_FULL_41_25]OGT62219.1 MAG: hypothetical protein A3I77_04580 [Gammaproteobacteria bacterium RIFCSPLOWO2_02_FULL_42_14]OGT85892.1 MAG: hypothetical protein A3G86_04270 [Gammaproteobacteria bacterium RIFCSPLOWO2_12_FULL_42_18]
MRELTGKDIRAMRPAMEVLPSELIKILPKRTVGKRGLQKTPTKISVTVRYNRDVVDYFKSTGDGWQSRMNNALQDWIKIHRRSA